MKLIQSYCQVGELRVWQLILVSQSNVNEDAKFVWLLVVGEEDELSIKEAAELVVEGMGFTGKLEVSFPDLMMRFTELFCFSHPRRPRGS